MDADDITQEVLIRLWKNIDNFNIMAAKSYIMKITHNLCIDYLRKNQAMTVKMVDIDEIFEETYADKKQDIDKFVHTAMITEKIKEAIQRLPETLRSIIILYEIQELKYTEISKILNIPVNSVKVYLFRARKKLQEELNEYAKLETA